MNDISVSALFQAISDVINDFNSYIAIILANSFIRSIILILVCFGIILTSVSIIKKIRKGV